MMSLFLDGADKTFSIGILSDNKLLYSKTYETSNDLAGSILVYLDNALRETGISAKEIEKVYCTNGPGSFTGVRIVLTLAKTLAWSLNIPIILLSSLEFIASINTNKKYILALIDARRDNVYAGLYDNNLRKVIKDKFINYDILIDEVKSKVDMSEVQIVSNYDFDDSIKPGYDIFKIVNRHKKTRSINPHKANPNYLKLTEAEEKLNAKRNK